MYERAHRIATEGDFLAPLFNPPVHAGNDAGAGRARVCPGGAGGANITGPAVADPVIGVMFVTSQSGCGSVLLLPGVESPMDSDPQSVKTLSRWVNERGGGEPNARLNVPEALDLEGTDRPYQRHRYEHRGVFMGDPKRRRSGGAAGNVKEPSAATGSRPVPFEPRPAGTFRHAGNAFAPPCKRAY